MNENTSNAIDRKILLSFGWSQGAIFPDIPQEGVNLPECNSNDFMFVISQDCDVLNYSLVKEPFVEVLCARNISDVNQMCINGRNTREYHFSFTRVIGTEELSYQILVKERAFLNRRYLEKVKSTECLRRGIIQNIARWMGLRYTREAFPDELNYRLNEIRKKNKAAPRFIHSILKKNEFTDDILDLYVAFQDEELPKDRDYELVITIEITPKTNESRERRVKIASLKNEIEMLLNEENSGICAECEIIAADEITHADILQLKRWSFFDDLSY
ncbi:MAG: hypothetical protein PHQ75_04140 [Thermoguttaceae bacterium]|nr:hypothetical protein [Thermoguttaceae bacterium]